MEWFILLMPLFEQLIKNCQDKNNKNRRSREDIEAGLNKPGIRERWALRITIREQMELRGRELTRHVRMGLAELKKLEPEDIHEELEAILQN